MADFARRITTLIWFPPEDLYLGSGRHKPPPGDRISLLANHRRGRSSFISLSARRLFAPERKRPSGRYCPQRAASSVAESEPASLPPGSPAGNPRSSEQNRTLEAGKCQGDSRSRSLNSGGQVSEVGGRRAPGGERGAWRGGAAHRDHPDATSPNTRSPNICLLARCPGPSRSCDPFPVRLLSRSRKPHIAVGKH